MAEFRRDAKILDLNGVGVVNDVKNLTSFATCRKFRQVQLEGNHEVSQKFLGDAKILDLRADPTIKEYLIVAVELVSQKFRGDAKILDLRADSVVKESFTTAVECGISHSTFSS